MKQLYRWVKASEKMIDIYSLVPAKRGNILGQLQREDERFVQFIWKGGVDSYTIKSENLGSIEWAEPVKEINQEGEWTKVCQMVYGNDRPGWPIEELSSKYILIKR